MTGTLFAPELRGAIERLNARFGTRLSVVGVENRYFGGDVSVAGLLTGECYTAARDSLRGKFIVIPASSSARPSQTTATRSSASTPSAARG